MSQAVRVLLLQVPRLLSDILEHAIREHDHCEVMKDTRGTLEMLTQEAPSPDIVVLGLSSAQDGGIVPALFARWPRAQVMTVMSAGDDATVYQLRPCETQLRQVPPAEIIAMLLRAVDRSRGLSGN